MSNVSATTFPWPIVASDLNLDSARSITPPKLFNVIAWIVGAEEDPRDDEADESTQFNNCPRYNISGQQREKSYA